jgi:hypothetical protein
MGNTISHAKVGQAIVDAKRRLVLAAELPAR